jgi:hypothetical protein
VHVCVCAVAALERASMLTCSRAGVRCAPGAHSHHGRVQRAADRQTASAARLTKHARDGSRRLQARPSTPRARWAPPWRTAPGTSTGSSGSVRSPSCLRAVLSCSLASFVKLVH